MGSRLPTQGYERALVRLEAALELALAERGDGDPLAQAVSGHLEAALAEIAQGSDGLADIALAQALARRMADDPRGSLSSQKSHGGFTMRSLLLD